MTDNKYNYINSNVFGLAKGGEQFLKRENIDLNKYKKLKNARNFNYALIAFSFLFSILLAGFAIYWLGEEDKDILPEWKKFFLWIILIMCIIIFILAAVTLLFNILYEKKIEAAITLNRSASNVIADNYIYPELHSSMGSILGNNNSEAEQITDFFNKKIGTGEELPEDLSGRYSFLRNIILKNINSLKEYKKYSNDNIDIKKANIAEAEKIIQKKINKLRVNSGVNDKEIDDDFSAAQKNLSFDLGVSVNPKYEFGFKSNSQAEQETQL